MSSRRSVSPLWFLGILAVGTVCLPMRGIATESDAAPVQAVKRLLEQLEPVTARTGTSVLRGRVQTPDGRPIAGAAVTAWRKPDSAAAIDSDRRSPQDSIERLRAPLTALVWRSMTAVRTTSGTDGQFAWNGLAAGLYVLEAQIDGFLVTSREVLATPEPRDVAGTLLVAHPLRNASLQLEADGTSLGSAELWFDCPGFPDGVRSRWSGAEQKIPLPSADCRLESVAASGRQYAAPGRKPVADCLEKRCTIRIEPRARIVGQVVVPEGQAPQGGTVVLADAAQFQDAMPVVDEWDSCGDLVQCRRIRGGPGKSTSFVFSDLAHGEYRVGFRPDSHGAPQALAWSGVSLGDTDVVVMLPVPTTEPDHLATVRGFGPDGRLLRDLAFRGGWRSSDGSSHTDGRMRPEPNADGSYPVALPRPPRGAEPATVVHTIEVLSESHGSRHIEFPPGESGERVVQFDAPAFVVARVRDRSRLEGIVKIHFDRQGEADARFAGTSRRVPQSGDVRFGPVVPGQYVVSLQMLRDGSRWSDSLWRIDRSVELKSGENVVDFDAPRLVDISLVASGATETTRISLEREGSDATVERHGNPGRDQRVVFRRVPTGSYRLSADGESAVVPASIVVEKDVEAIVHLQAPDALQVPTEADEALKKAGLLPGDVILAVDGQGFKGQSTVRKGLIHRLLKPRVTLTVRRGGRNFRLGFSPWVLGEHGHHLEPVRQ